MSKAENPRAVPGDNSGERVAADELRQFIERLEKLAEDKAEVQTDMKDVFAEAKGRGFSTKAIRTILRARKEDSAKRQEHQALVQLYADALGMGDVFA